MMLCVTRWAYRTFARITHKMASKDYSEDALVEQPAIKLFASLGWQTANLFCEKFGEKSTLGRETTSEVIFVPR